MGERILVSGNNAVARGAIQAGCKYFFGYPITPQSEIPEYMSQELPKIGGVFVQSESESGSIYMVYGGGLTGERVMTSTSSPGLSLMAEGISYLAEMEVPAVIVDVVRMGPGIGTGGQGGQTDYLQVTKGCGHGGYHAIVLAPASCQEIFDHMQLAFYLADKYRTPVLVVTDFILGQSEEPIEIRTLDFDPLPEKDWALTGKDKKGGNRVCNIAAFFAYLGVVNYHMKQIEKYNEIKKNEVRYDTYLTEDCDLLLIAYGSSARIARGAVEMGRAKGLKLGLLRPISLWPFPKDAVSQKASKAGKVLVVEDSQGQLIEDVEASIKAPIPIHLLGMWARHNYGGGGIIHPERIIEEVEKINGK
ncbi:MAG: 3-methyl-2-oxobutanoate dehydrogenase subunit VorB [Thermodesulfobacteriota bacterium]|nr:3-methyl-2-oxobutanoate dehydrogenase subunit VorB [Thermodesulfobacteriota bacterium]